MKLRTLGAAIVRRWYVFIAGILAVGGLSYLMYGMIPVDYKTTGSLVLLPSAKAVGIDGNPYLFLGGLGQAMDVLTRRITAADVTDRLTGPYPKSSYTALPDVTAGSSIMVVTVKAHTASESTRLLTAILVEAPKQLAAMQDELKVPDGSRISSMQVAEPTEPVVDGKPRLQAVAGAGAAGLLLVLLMTATFDGAMLRRRARRGGAAKVDTTDAESQMTPPVVAEGTGRIHVLAGSISQDGESPSADPDAATASSDEPVPLRRRRAATGDHR
ncbi:hypothetical protein [Sinomonas sp. R1AF57]|uniref:hypothetical protein n=1 Tax=Sinomonas sp. R1AF57 TaxID=2020377 RepID=UPI000B61766E|nr:hypothetical protein [Sinomonas sp. R1AF57]ASN51484.1 hypothetical protein CGQ25_04850 [Sinomonas sp. R1AF57]